MNYVGQIGIAVDNKFAIGSTVYFVTDTEQNPCQVTSILIRPEHLIYEVSRGGMTCLAYDFELTKEKSIATVTA